jgi:5-hydroxyisourate hydrolase
MAKLSTHVLDTAHGRPAQGMKIELWRWKEAGPTLLWEGSTNTDGRTETPPCEGTDFSAGEYELCFFVGEYFARLGTPAAFLSVVPVRFLADPATGNYHVPLLCSPWSYTTYRGS